MHQTCIHLCKCDASSANLHLVHKFTEQLLVVLYLHTPLPMRMGRVSHSHKMADCISFSTLTTPREEGKKKKKKLRMALNGTDCKADPGISNCKCISYVKSWINSEYDSMHIHIKLKSQPEPRFRAVFFFFFWFIIFNKNMIWNYINSPSFYCAKWRNCIRILFRSILKIQDSSLNHFISHSVCVCVGGVFGLGYGIYKL